MTELDPDGCGGFSGLSEPGQTFYFPRVLTEETDSPTLRLDAADRIFSVFLDETLLYTDCPELDNRIGYLQLPMLERYGNLSDAEYGDNYYRVSVLLHLCQSRK